MTASKRRTAGPAPYQHLTVGWCVHASTPTPPPCVSVRRLFGLPSASLRGAHPPLLSPAPAPRAPAHRLRPCTRSWTRASTRSWRRASRRRSRRCSAVSATPCLPACRPAYGGVRARQPSQCLGGCHASSVHRMACGGPRGMPHAACAGRRPSARMQPRAWVRWRCHAPTPESSSSGCCACCSPPPPTGARASGAFVTRPDNKVSQLLKRLLKELPKVGLGERE